MRQFCVLLLFAGGIILAFVGIGWQVFPGWGATETGCWIFLIAAGLGSLASVGGFLAVLKGSPREVKPAIPVTRAAVSEENDKPGKSVVSNARPTVGLLEKASAEPVLGLRTKPPVMGDLPPDGYIPRWLEYEELIEALLEPQGSEVVGITTALEGARGYGKTTLAQAVCQDPRVWEAFPDGILWATPCNPASYAACTASIGELISFLEGRPPQLVETREAGTHLQEILRDRRALLVIDDAWQRTQLEYFLQPGSKTLCLVITLDDEILPPGAPRVRVDEMRRSETVALLCTVLKSAGVPEEELDSLHDALSVLAERCGDWPLLASLAGGCLTRLIDQGFSAGQASVEIIQAYDRLGLAPFDAQDGRGRSRAIAAALSAILELLRPDQKERFEALAVFSESDQIPLGALEVLWGAVERIDPLEVKELCNLLHRLSLVQRYDPGAEVIQVHKVVRSSLVERQAGQLRELHARLVSGYRRRCPGGQWSAGPQDGYFFMHLAQHLAAAGQAQELSDLLLDPAWMAARLRNGGIWALLEDYDIGLRGDLAAREVVQLAQGALSLAHDALEKAPDQLVGQLFGRLAAFEQAEIQKLLADAARLDVPLWLKPVRAFSAVPGGSQDLPLVEHSGRITALAFTLDHSQVVTGSTDGALKVWDLESGRLLRSLKGHGGEVLSVAAAPNGKRLISTAKDRVIHLWVLESGRLSGSLRSHPAWLKAAFVLITPDGRRAVSGLPAGPARVWELETGRLVCQLNETNSPVHAIAFSLNGQRAIIYLGDPALRVWDLIGGEVLHCLAFPADRPGAVAISPDGRRAASAAGNVLQVWDLAKAQVHQRLTGHTGTVNCIAFTPNGSRILSGSDDGELMVWDLDGGRLCASLDLDSAISVCGFSPDGQFAAAGGVNGEVYLLRLVGDDSVVR